MNCLNDIIYELFVGSISLPGGLLPMEPTDKFWDTKITVKSLIKTVSELYNDIPTIFGSGSRKP